MSRTDSPHVVTAIAYCAPVVTLVDWLAYQRGRASQTSIAAVLLVTAGAALAAYELHG